MQKNRFNYWQNFFKPSRLLWAGAPSLRPEGGQSEKSKPKPKEKAEAGGEAKKKLDKNKRKIKDEVTKESEKLRRQVEFEKRAVKALFRNKKALRGFISASEAELDKPGAQMHLKLEFFKVLGAKVNSPQAINNGLRLIQTFVYKTLEGKGVNVEGQPGQDITAEFLDALDKFLLLDADTLHESRPDEKEEIMRRLSQREAGAEGGEVSDEVKLFQEHLQANVNHVYQDYRRLLEAHPEAMSEGIDTDSFYEFIQTANYEPFDTESIEGWREAFKKTGVDESKIRDMGLLPANSDEILSIHQSPKDEVKFKNTLEKGDLKALSKEAADHFASSVESDSRAEMWGGKIDGYKVDLQRVQEEPSVWWNSLKDHPGLKRGFEKYQRKYAALKPFMDLGEGFESKKDEKEEAYKQLGDAIDTLEREYLKIDAETAKAYEERVESIISRYDFPPGIPLGEFSRPLEVEDNPYYRSLMSESKIHNLKNFLADLMPKNESGKLIIPTRIMRSEFEFYEHIKGYTTGEKKTNFDRIKKRLEAWGVTNPINEINRWIYRENIKRFSKENLALNLELDKERLRKIRLLESKSFEALLELK